MFTYCLSNPILFTDDSGARPVVTASLNNETAADRSASCEYMRELAKSKKNGNTDNLNIISYIDPKSPPDHPKYNPPKGGHKKVRNPNGEGKGWEDKNGNVWVPTPKMHGGEGWTVQKPDGGHYHAYPGGKIRETHLSGAVGTTQILFGVVAATYLIANDISGVGFSDDTLIPVACGFVSMGWDQITENDNCYYCER